MDRCFWLSSTLVNITKVRIYPYMGYKMRNLVRKIDRWCQANWMTYSLNFLCFLNEICYGTWVFQQCTIRNIRVSSVSLWFNAFSTVCFGFCKRRFEKMFNLDIIWKNLISSNISRMTSTNGMIFGI